MFKTFENFETYSRPLKSARTYPFLSLTMLFVLMLNAGLAQVSGYQENKGQWDDAVTHKLDMSHGSLWLDREGWSLRMWDDDARHEAIHHLHENDSAIEVPGHVIKMRFVDGKAVNSVEQHGKSTPYSNYFIGNNPRHWASHVHAYSKVVQKEVYKGVDVVYEMDGRNPKSTYIVHPGSDPSVIRLRIDGHRELTVKDGDLLIKTSVGDVWERRLRVFQTINGVEEVVDARFRVQGSEVSFILRKYDKAYPIYIDPTIIASTNSGSTSNSFGHTATFNEAGQIYSAGRCFGAGYPVDTGSFQSTFNGAPVDMCLSKYNTDGSELIYATYIGGNGEDLPHSMVANSSDHIIILGSSNSADYPFSPGAIDSTYGGGKDVVLTVLSSDGSQLIGSTYVGGSNGDGVNNQIVYYADDYRGEVVVDSLDNIYVASFSRSPNFPTTAGVLQDTLAGDQDGVVFKTTPNLDSLLWSTYLGGADRDVAYALKVSDSGFVYVAGSTRSTDFPLFGTGETTTHIGDADAFIVKLDSNGANMISGTYYGTTARDQNYFVEIDDEDYVYAFGTSNGSITSSAGKYAGPGSGGYIMKMNSSLSTTQWVSTLGNLAPAAFLVDNCDRIYISGQAAVGAPLNLTSFDTINAVNSLGLAGFYLMKLSPDAEDLEFGSFFGNNGSHVDGGTSRFDKRGVVYQATCSNGIFPTTDWAYSDSNLTGAYDNTVFKIDFASNIARASILPSDSLCANAEAEFDNEGSIGNVHFWDFGDGSTSMDSLPTHIYDSVGTFNITYVITDSGNCYGYDTAHVILEVTPPVIPEIFIGDTICVDSVRLFVDTMQFVDFTWSNGSNDWETYVSNSGVYSVTTTAALQCVHSDNLNVDFTPAYHFELSDTGICELGSPIFGPSEALSYSWSTGDSTRSTIITETGLYSLTASNGLCLDTQSLNVFVAFADFGASDTFICTDELVLSVNHSGESVLWSTNEITDSITVTNTGEYWVEVSTGFCSSIDTINVDFNPQLVELGDDFVACGSAQLSALGDYESIAWNTGDTTKQIIIDSSGRYRVTVWDKGCKDVDTINVEVQHLKFALDTAIACDIDSAILSAPVENEAIYLWSTGDTVDSIVTLENGAYWVSVRTPHCSNTDTVELLFISTPKYSIGEDTAMCIGERLRLSPDSIYGQVSWNTGDTINSLDVLTSGTYIVTQAYKSCPRQDTIEVTMRSLIADSLGMVNNVMTPNNDKINDELAFYIEPELVTDYQLLVYDRWGLKVFETTELLERWDGVRPNGEPAPDGTYFYIMKAKTVCIQKPYLEVMDNVTLFR